MIEKLKRPVKIGGTTFREKINELVDAVNVLQTTNTHIQNDLHEMRHSKTKTRPENVQPMDNLGYEDVDYYDDSHLFGDEQ